MKWNGIVSQCEKTTMQSRFTTENRAHATSTQATRHGQLKLPRAWAARALARRLAPRVKASPAGSECHSPAARGARDRGRLVSPVPSGAASRTAVSCGAAAGDGSGARALPGACGRSRTREASLRPVATVCRSRPAFPSLRGELISLTTHRLY